MTLSTQFITMLTMVGMGSFFGAAFDTYNRFLKRASRKSWLVFLNDVLFWVLQGLLIFYVLFLVNEGEMRFYIFIALVCGFAAYQSLLRRIYLHVLEIVITWIVSIWRFLVRLFMGLIYKPILALLAFCLSTIVLIGKALFSLSKSLLRLLGWIVLIILKPIQLILLLFWKLLPKGIKKSVEKLYNRMAGFLRKIKKYFSKAVAFLKNKIKHKK
ncbi:spore cortex biosynthesis protein YabQ [Bacillus marasmi]|uniref:spore cortex biosynthesis protein YabQ n=1 Tax=Bacillus marasmi TaxID=1926279 RepID=UPI0011CC209C|nr:spore cortex biosynthesis protein YabQ [Bacillus marasmi]